MSLCVIRLPVIMLKVDAKILMPKSMTVKLLLEMIL